MELICGALTMFTNTDRRRPTDVVVGGVEIALLGGCGQEEVGSRAKEAILNAAYFYSF